MKKLMLVGLACCAGILFLNGKPKKDISINALSSRQEIGYAADSITVCKFGTPCMVGTLKAIAAAPAYYVLFYKQADQSWMIRTDPKQVYNEMLRIKKIKSITIGSGNIKVGGVAYPEKKFALIQ